MKTNFIPQSAFRFSLLLILAAAAGCSGAQKQAPTQLMGDTKFSMMKYSEGIIPAQYGQRIMALEGPIAETLVLTNERVGRLPSGQVDLSFGLHNPTDVDNLWVDWKVAFYDQSNFLIDETEWQKTLFPPNQVTMLHANSISPAVQNYSVVLRVPPDAKAYEAAVRAAELKKAQEEAEKKADEQQAKMEKNVERMEKFAETTKKMVQVGKDIRANINIQ